MASTLSTRALYMFTRFIFLSVDINYENRINDNNVVAKRLNIIKSLVRLKTQKKETVDPLALLLKDEDTFITFMNIADNVLIDFPDYIKRHLNIMIEAWENASEGEYLQICNVCKEIYDVIDKVAV